MFGARHTFVEQCAHAFGVRRKVFFLFVFAGMRSLNVVTSL